LFLELFALKLTSKNEFEYAEEYGLTQFKIKILPGINNYLQISYLRFF